MLWSCAAASSYFFDGVPVVVRKQVPEPQGQAGGQAGDFPVLRGGEIGGEKLLLGVFVENLHQVCHNQKTITLNTHFARIHNIRATHIVRVKRISGEFL